MDPLAEGRLLAPEPDGRGRSASGFADRGHLEPGHRDPRVARLPEHPGRGLRARDPITDPVLYVPALLRLVTLDGVGVVR